MSLPSVRKVYVPDPGYCMFDTDLSSADLRIVTWESDCKLMKEWFAQGLDPYTMVAREYYHEPEMTKKDARRQRFKSVCHASNYLGIARNIAGNANIGLSVPELERVQAWYFGKFPEIKRWQQKVIAQVNHAHMITNAFGNRQVFMGRIDNRTYNEAVAWIPQSTVALVINRAWKNIYNNLPDVQILMQVHDSLVGQFPSRKPDLYQAILDQCQIVIPYADPLIIPMGSKTSTISWGDCK